jgi:DNA-binding NarL/FixJ family response regulator
MLTLKTRPTEGVNLIQTESLNKPSLDQASAVAQRNSKVKKALLATLNYLISKIEGQKAGSDLCSSNHPGNLLEDSVKTHTSQIIQQEIPLNSEVRSKILRSYKKLVAQILTNYNLTCRELEIAHFILQGADYETIAAEANISPSTVKTHVRSILKKTNSASRQEFSYKINQLLENPNALYQETRPAPNKLPQSA